MVPISSYLYDTAPHEPVTHGTSNSLQGDASKLTKREKIRCGKISKRLCGEKLGQRMVASVFKL